MATPEDEAAEAAREWGTAQATAVDLPRTVVGSAPPDIWDVKTPPVRPEDLPGFEPGRQKGISETLDAMQDELVQGGTDPGVASIVATKLGAKVRGSSRPVYPSAAALDRPGP